MLKRRISDLIVAAVNLERRVDPYFRDPFDRVFQKPISAVVQAFINRRRPDQRLGIAEEQLLPGAEEITSAIIRQMALFLQKTYRDRYVERAGNTKTYGVVRGEFEVLPGLARTCGMASSSTHGPIRPGFVSRALDRWPHPTSRTTAS